MSKAKRLLLRRKDVKLKVNKELWAEAILQSQLNGWKPEKESLAYLAHPLTISTEETDRIYLGLENFFNKASKGQIHVDPLRINMRDLFQLLEFIYQGGFSTENIAG